MSAGSQTPGGATLFQPQWVTTVAPPITRDMHSVNAWHAEQKHMEILHVNILTIVFHRCTQETRVRGNRRSIWPEVMVGSAWHQETAPHHKAKY